MELKVSQCCGDTVRVKIDTCQCGFGLIAIKKQYVGFYSPF